ncbi:MAG: response regulator [Deltaproteobacteria bacterium]|jgi:signal transduction histidine kinase/CheY-like chemotaxis protein|nr:response regulator [Deltaproteobacteria bacterium]
MKKMHLKIFGILACLVIAIIALTVMAGFFFVRSGVERTAKSQIAIIGKIGERLVSDRFELFRSQADGLAELLADAPPERLDGLLGQELNKLPGFTGVAIFKGGEALARAGENPPPESLAREECTRAAASGRRYVTTTVPGPEGALVFYYCSPASGRSTLAFTLPGMFFSDLLREFPVWKTGSLYVLDQDGTVIANVRERLVLERYNAAHDLTYSKEAVTSGEHTRRMIRGGEGTGSYYLEGKLRVAAWRPVTGNDRGWVFGASAPLVESPTGQIYRGLFMMSLVFLCFGIAAAFFTSRVITRQFDLINRQNAHLEEANAAAAAASETKTVFLANMSHEMRTPLNAIVGFSELMLNGIAAPEETEDNLRRIRSAGVTLLGIVNDILDISKIESGKFEMVPVEYDVASVINDTVAVNMIRIGEKDITFKLSIDPCLPARLMGDELRIKQICNNFLSNAFKYTRQGTVELGVSCTVNGEEVWLMLSVRDTGVGIRREDVAKLFSAYNQVDTKSNRLIEGTGLGLSIALRMAQMMGGTIDVESEYGKGSVFTATVRQGWVTDETLAAEERAALESFKYNDKHSAAGHRLAVRPLPYARVLIVDDVQTNLDVARGMLRPYRMRIDCVTSGARAVSLIRNAEAKYDAVFMDHMMPGMDGIEATRIIREEIGTDYARNVPIIAFTANALIGNDELFLSRGFQAYLSKPIDMAAMGRVLQKYVRNKGKEQKLALGEALEASAGGGGPAGGAGPVKPGEAARRQPGNGAEAPEAPSEDAAAPAAAAEGAEGAEAPPRPAGLAGRGNGGPTAAPGPAPAPSQAAGAQAGPGLELGRVDGLDIEAGITRFGGDFGIYRDTLRSFAVNTKELLGQIREPDKSGLKDYLIRVHGIKSSAYGVCAAPLGKAAEDLEAAARQGDLAFIAARNPPFLAQAGKLTAELEAFLGESAAANGERERAEAPDPELVRRMVGACRAWDMDGVDRAVEELGRRVYESEPGLVDWVKERVEHMELDKIVERFAAVA